MKLRKQPAAFLTTEPANDDRLLKLEAELADIRALRLEVERAMGPRPIMSIVRK